MYIVIFRGFMKKIFLCLFIALSVSSCSSNMVSDPIICEKNCKQACLISNKDYKGFDDNIGCFCADK